MLIYCVLAQLSYERQAGKLILLWVKKFCLESVHTLHHWEEVYIGWNISPGKIGLIVRRERKCLLAQEPYGY